MIVLGYVVTIVASPVAHASSADLDGYGGSRSGMMRVRVAFCDPVDAVSSDLVDAVANPPWLQLVLWHLWMLYQYPWRLCHEFSNGWLVPVHTAVGAIVW